MDASDGGRAVEEGCAAGCWERGQSGAEGGRLGEGETGRGGRGGGCIWGCAGRAGAGGVARRALKGEVRSFDGWRRGRGVAGSLARADGAWVCSPPASEHGRRIIMHDRRTRA